MPQGKHGHLSKSTYFGHNMDAEESDDYQVNKWLRGLPGAELSVGSTPRTASEVSFGRESMRKARSPSLCSAASYRSLEVETGDYIPLSRQPSSRMGRPGISRGLSNLSMQRGIPALSTTSEWLNQVSSHLSQLRGFPDASRNTNAGNGVYRERPSPPVTMGDTNLSERYGSMTTGPTSSSGHLLGVSESTSTSNKHGPTMKMVFRPRTRHILPDASIVGSSPSRQLADRSENTRAVQWGQQYGQRRHQGGQ